MSTPSFLLRTRVAANLTPRQMLKRTGCKGSTTMRRSLVALTFAVFGATALMTSAAPVGNGFTYQGQLKRGGSAYTGTCNLQYSVWDAAEGGTALGGGRSISDVSVVDGLFTVLLNVGPQFEGNAAWLQVAVQCSGDEGFTTLQPRQPLTAVPFAQSLPVGASIIDRDTGTGRSVLTVASTSQFGIALNASGSVGVRATSTTPEGVGLLGSTGGDYSHAVSGTAVGKESIGVYGVGGDTAMAGVYGSSSNASGSGVYGRASGTNSAGVFGLNDTGAGIWGRSTGPGSAVYGENSSGGRAAFFAGPVHVQGTLSKSAGTFKIDHPLDPANKYLSHSFVESPEMKNIYDGVVMLDAQGQAVVELPAYFEALNRDFRYQLTCIGGVAPVYIAQEIAQNRFRIAGGTPGLKVSWLVTGNRRDAYAEANRLIVEEEKPPHERGLYLYPAGVGAGEEKGLGRMSHPAGDVHAPIPPGPQPSH